MKPGRHRFATPLMIAAVLAAVATLVPPPAGAAPKPWNGRYQMLTYASQKAGTSPAAQQR